jgi:hypothetical protein
MELVSDVGRVESHFSLFIDSFSVSATDARFAPNIPHA